MAPKRALNVMDCEVNKLFVLTKQAIIPMPYVVPRKVCRYILEIGLITPNCLFEMTILTQ